MSKPQKFVAKYRPRSLQDIVGQSHITDLLQKWIEAYKQGEFRVPHMLLAGIEGVGKTATAKSFAHDCLGPDWKQSFLDKNASDERGIGTIRKSIKDYARSQHFSDFAIIFLDEADNLTKDAQSALRRILEDYEDHTVFILSVNHPNKIIPPIRSRCAILRFQLVPDNDIRGLLVWICGKEEIDINPDALDKIEWHVKGRVRDAVELLYDLSPYKHITLAHVNQLIRENPESCWESIYSQVKDGDLKDADISLIKLYRNGYGLQECFDRFYELIINDKMISKPNKIKLLMKMAEFDYRMIMGSNQLLQARSFLWYLHFLISKGK